MPYLKDTECEAHVPDCDIFCHRNYLAATFQSKTVLKQSRQNCTTAMKKLFSFSLLPSSTVNSFAHTKKSTVPFKFINLQRVSEIYAILSRKMHCNRRFCYHWNTAKWAANHTCSPQQPMAFIMEALWTTFVAMPFSFALNSRSAWVVALSQNNRSNTRYEMFCQHFFNAHPSPQLAGNRKPEVDWYW